MTDVLVVGAGPAGVVAALRAADLGALLAYMAAYLLIYPCGLILMFGLVRKGPLQTSESAAAIEAGRPATPVLAPAINVVKGEVR